VRASIDLDHKARGDAREVREVRPDGVLPTKTQPGDLALA